LGLGRIAQLDREHIIDQIRADGRACANEAFDDAIADGKPLLEHQRPALRYMQIGFVATLELDRQLGLQRRKRPFAGVAVDPEDLPVSETEAAYLAGWADAVWGESNPGRHIGR
jgi:hypothetical protein